MLILLPCFECSPTSHPVMFSDDGEQKLVEIRRGLNDVNSFNPLLLWRWRDSNPRPQHLFRDVYKRSRYFEISPSGAPSDRIMRIG